MMNSECDALISSASIKIGYIFVDVANSKSWIGFLGVALLFLLRKCCITFTCILLVDLSSFIET